MQRLRRELHTDEVISNTIYYTIDKIIFTTYSNNIRICIHKYTI